MVPHPHYGTMMTMTHVTVSNDQQVVANNQWVVASNQLVVAS